MYPHENFFATVLAILRDCPFYPSHSVIAPFIISFIIYNYSHVFQLEY